MQHLLNTWESQILSCLLVGIPYGGNAKILEKKLNQKYDLNLNYVNFLYGIDSLSINRKKIYEDGKDFFNKLTTKQINPLLFEWIKEFLEETIDKFENDDELETIVGCTYKEALDILDKLTKLYHEK